MESLIESECARYVSCEQVRQSFVTTVSQVRAMKISVDRNILDTLSGKREVTTQLLGKRVFDEVGKVIDRYPILRAVVDGHVDLASMIGEVEVVEVRKEKVQISKITQNEINEFKDLCDLECDTVVDFLEEFRGSSENTEFGLREMENKIFPGLGQRGGYKTFILRGGLHEYGRMNQEVIRQFDDAADRIRVFLEVGTPAANAQARGWTTQLEELKMEYFREIWQLEDEVGPRGYIRGSVVPVMRKQLKREITRLKSGDEAETVSEEVQESFAQRVDAVKEMVRRKWRERKIQASKIIKEQEKDAKDFKPSAQEEKGKRAVLVNGYIELSNEIVMKIQESVNVEIRGELNRQVLEKIRGIEYYSSLDRRFLPGVMMILKEKYQSAPIHMMFDSLEELFTGHIANADAGRVNDWMDAKILLWAEFNFFDYFVPDVLFTFVTLFRMPEGQVKARAIQSVLTKMRERPEEFVREKLKERRTMMSDMPLRAVVKDVVRESRMVSKIAHREERKDQKRVITQNKEVVGVTPGVVQAHVAQHHQQQQHQHRTTPSGGQQRLIAKTERLPGKITREENMWIETTKGRFSYTATEDPCQKCQKGPPDQRHRGLCVLTMCGKCQLFGHREDECRQRV